MSSICSIDSPPRTHLSNLWRPVPQESSEELSALPRVSPWFPNGMSERAPFAIFLLNAEGSRPSGRSCSCRSGLFGVRIERIEGMHGGRGDLGHDRARVPRSGLGVKGGPGALGHRPRPVHLSFLGPRGCLYGPFLVEIMTGWATYAPHVDAYRR